ncbi:MAG: LytTR family transcriptional regulator DNA-binding domain-containing protein [Flavobacterium sp.]|nr:LytTR family transcriptional regulator DNA-binding domain-containing protein [Flavobacterium sp.]PZO35035.1 MAG: hypothetical protein DCE86_00070 [Flavobacteriaceae bacterium]
METVNYGNRKLRLTSAFIASIYIVFHGIPVDLVKAFSSPGFYAAVAVSFAISLLLVNVVHMVTIWLDRKCSWRERPFERGVLQLIFGVVAPALTDLLLISIYFGILGQSIVDNGFLLIDYPLIVCFIVFFNLYYLIHYLVASEKQYFKVAEYPNLSSTQVEQHEEELGNSISGANFNIHYNGQHLFFNVANDILYFHREGKRVRAMTVNGNQYPINDSIYNLENRFSEDGLCRINRSTIVNYKMVKGYLAGTRRDTAQLIIKPSYLPFVADPNSTTFQVTKEFLSSFRSGLEEL